MASTRRKSAAIALAVIGIAGLSLASASTLSLTSGTLQSGTTVLADCQPTGTPIAVSFTSSYTPSSYKVTGITLSGVHADCVGKAVRVTLAGAAGASLAEVTGTAALGAATSLSAVPAGISAADVLSAAVVISG